MNQPTQKEKRKLAELLYTDTTTITYKSFRLHLINNETEILAKDFDGRVYNPIQINTSLPTDDQLSNINTQLTTYLTQLHNEL
jgi:hypothetical protein